MNKANEQLVVLINETIETKFYWVFFYNSKRFIETGNMSYTLAGNAPYIVDKIKGGIYKTGTAYAIEKYMTDFENYVLPTLI